VAFHAKNTFVDTTLIIIVFAALILVLSLGTVLFVRTQRRLLTVSTEAARLEATLGERTMAREQIQTQMRDTFRALSSEALKAGRDDFLVLAQQRLAQTQVQSQAELEKREKAVEQLVIPIREALEKTRVQIQELEKERHGAYKGLCEMITRMTADQQTLTQQTQNLVKALRRPEVRGRWGELQLRRTVELAGMTEHCDFVEQTSIAGPDGMLRPDMVVTLPGGGTVVVDSKAPLDAYISAIEAPNDEDRVGYLDKHARQVREQVRRLSGKAYWESYAQSADFVVLFLPGEQFLSAALERDPTLLEEAMKSHVVLATPGTLMALLRTVALGWQQQSLVENMDAIRRDAMELHQRLATFAEHLVKLGGHLGGSIKAYNSVVGSLEHQVLPAVRRWQEKGIQSKKEIPAIDPVDETVRRVDESEPTT